MDLIAQYNSESEEEEETPPPPPKNVCSNPKVDVDLVRWKHCTPARNTLDITANLQKDDTHSSDSKPESLQSLIILIQPRIV